MDSSVTRRGQPCWFRKPNVGMVAINDAFLLESCIYILLKKYFKGQDYYLDLLELFHEVTIDLKKERERKMEFVTFGIPGHFPDRAGSIVRLDHGT